MSAAVAEMENRAAAERRSWVEVSLTQVAKNFRAVREVVGDGVEVMAVVKADAYRHGAIEVSRALEQSGARWLAVSNANEAIALREAGIRSRIVVMADFLPVEREALLAYELTPVIHSLDMLAEWNALAVRAGRRLQYHLKIDSGMGRLGARATAAEVIAQIQANPAIEFEGLMTHFASAADYVSGQTEDQVAVFGKELAALVEAGLRPQYTHLSSTTPIAYGRREAWGNMVRPGHAIYGYVSQVKGVAPERVLDVKPALQWKAAILSVKDVPAGSPIGYGAIYRTQAPTRIGILGAGYADGIPHRLSNRGKVIAGGKLAPILGAVSMDLTTIDITACPELGPGDAVTLLGSEDGVSIDAQQIARWAGTISYSVLCGIHSRVTRVYRD